MRIFAPLAVALALSATVLAQTPDPPLPATGTVITSSPMFWLRDADRTPIVLVRAGSPVQVLAREGIWYLVVYHDPRVGDQTGYMAPHDIHIDPSATSSPPTTTSVVSERGFLEGRGFGFPQTAPNDDVRAFGEALVREEVFLKPTRWLQFAVGGDLRASSHDQVEDEWRLDFEDRGVLRPRLAVRRLTAAITTSHVSVDVGKQFIRWGRADILSPTDRFAPRDYLNVIDSDFLPVIGARTSIHTAGETFELVWLPQLTPSRLPLLDQRWTVVPSAAAGLTLEDNGSVFPEASEQGVRWSHTGRFEMGLSYLNGFNHLADINAVVDPARATAAITRTYPDLRTFGGELSVPTRAFILKGEAAYFASPPSTSEEYVLYVVEAERQVGEWLLDGGYAGEVVTESREGLSFSPERGMARSIIGRAAYTVDPRRSVAIEGAVHQNGHGFYTKGEFSEAFGQHWRLTLAGVGIGGKEDDFLGQYHRNSHVSATMRLSF